MTRHEKLRKISPSVFPRFEVIGKLQEGIIFGQEATIGTDFIFFYIKTQFHSFTPEHAAKPNHPTFPRLPGFRKRFSVPMRRAATKIDWRLIMPGHSRPGLSQISGV